MRELTLWADAALNVLYDSRQVIRERLEWSASGLAAGLALGWLWGHGRRR